MIMKKLLLLCCVSLLFLFGACEFSPDGSYFEEVNPEPEIQAHLNLDVAADTIYLRGFVELDFSISLPGRNLEEYQVLIGNELVQKGYQLSDKIKIQSSNFADGYHLLKLLVRANSGTGSLGDVVGAEKLEVYRTWVLEINNGKPSPVKITRIYEHEGRLKIEWEEYGYPDFKNYLLYKDGRNAFYPFTPITNPRFTSWIDSSFVGGKATYDLAVRVEGAVSDKERIQFTHPLPKILEHEFKEGNDLLLKFSATPFYNNFGAYELSGYPDEDGVLSYEIKSRLDTILQVPDIGFGQGIEFYLQTIPSNQKYFHEYVQEKIGYTVAIGEPHSFGDLAAYISKTNTFYGIRYGFQGTSIFTVDGAAFEQKHTEVLFKNDNNNFLAEAISANGEWLYVAKGNEILQLDPHTLETLATFSVAGLTGSEYTYSVLDLHVSNNNRLAIAAYHAYLQDSVFLVDMNTSKIVIKEKTPYYRESVGISADGRLFCFGDRNSYSIFYHENEAGSWSREELETPVPVKFSPSEAFYVRVEGSQVSLFNSESNALLKVISTEVPLSNIGFDSMSGYLWGTGEDGYFYVYDPSTGSMLKRIKLVKGSFVKLFQNKLFSNGHYLLLE